MLKDEKYGRRPIFRPNSFIENEKKRLEKLRKAKLWHQVGMEEDIVGGAPLIICPSTCDQISKKMKNVLKRFKEEHKINVKLCERGGSKIGNIAKSDPLKPPTCSREDCFSCSAEGGGDCRRGCAA